MNWNRPNVTWADGAKWGGVAAIVGTVMGVLLSDSGADTAAAWGDAVRTVAACVVTAAGAFVLAIRAK